MKGNEFLDKMELIDPAYVEAADRKPARRKNAWIKWVAAAACLCLFVGSIAVVQHLSKSKPDLSGLPNKTTAKVLYGYDESIASSSKDSLVWLSEEEMFSREDMYIFRGKISEMTNVIIDFNGTKVARCIATVVINEVYKGNVLAGQQIKMLLPCAIKDGRGNMKDSRVLERLICGMEGIFMPYIYDETSYMERNGAVLMLQELAACGIGDGMRWVFLSTDKGLVFADFAYPGAKDAVDLDDIEDYIIEMLK